MLSGSRYSFLNLIVEATLVINGAALIFLCIAAFKRSSRIALIGAIIFSISWIVSFATDVVVIPAFLGYSESEPTALAQVVLSIAGGVLLAASATGRPKTALRIAAAIAFALLLITKIFVNVLCGLRLLVRPHVRGGHRVHQTGHLVFPGTHRPYAPSLGAALLLGKSARDVRHADPRSGTDPRIVHRHRRRYAALRPACNRRRTYRRGICCHQKAVSEFVITHL